MLWHNHLQHGLPLLVTSQNVADFIAVLIQCVIYIQDCAARITEHRIDALLQKTLDDDF